MDTFLYRGEKRREISFPLGGVGTGCVSLAGDGRLVDWEIFNRPNKQSANGFSGFVVRTEREGEPADIRALQGPVTASRMGAPHNFGYGMDRATCAGWPHFRENVFVGDFPVARVDLTDESFPGGASVTAFNPFIPLNDEDSSLPAALFEIALTNGADTDARYTLCFSAENPVKLAPRNRAAEGKYTGVVLGSESAETDAAQYGEICLMTDAPDADRQICWYRGHWFDAPGMFWNDLKRGGRLPARDYDAPAPGDHATVCAYLCAKPGETVRARFVLSWYFPNQYAYWHEGAPAERDAKAQWKNYYATRFPGAAAVASYALTEYKRLYGETRVFRDALYRSHMPRPALEAVAANLSLLKSATVLRLEDGTFYGWEGCGERFGSCEGSCTHVWNYAYALAYLFPKLEKSIRDADYAYNFEPDGRMGFRLQLPLGAPASAFRACCDGQFGGIVKMYREWRVSGDTKWLRKWWPRVKKSLEYAWSADNYDRWDRDRDGVLEGRQHHTLDMELFGPNSWLESLYLAALKAASRMADALGDTAARDEYDALFARGKAWSDEHLFNGEYFCQRIDLTDRATLDAFRDTQASMTGGVYDAYWNEEGGELKYQIGEGCAIDQVLGQWHADLAGLGDVLDRAKVDSALRAIHKYNYQTRLGDVFNPCRLYGLEEERGALICAYPEGRKKPLVSVPYAEETMHGFEYQAASHMILRGMEQEGLDLVRAVRDRYDGGNRNPFNEMECGSNYARSMASYALLLAYSGFRYDAVTRDLEIAPVHFEKGYRAFFSAFGAWGECAYDGETFTIAPLEGEIEIQRIKFPGGDWINPPCARAAKDAPLAVRV